MSDVHYLLASEEMYSRMVLGIIRQRQSLLVTRSQGSCALSVALATAATRSLVIQATRFSLQSSSGANSLRAHILTSVSIPSGVGEYGRHTPPNHDSGERSDVERSFHLGMHKPSLSVLLPLST
jgi:hypothetical protein